MSSARADRRAYTRRKWLAALAVLGPALAIPAGTSTGADSAGVPPPPLLAEPGLSPDGSEIAFVSGGDIWTVPASGGTAHLLVSDPAEDARPMYSPDGRHLAFESARGGATDLYVLVFASGELRRLTFDDSSEALEGFSPDGRWVYFSSSTRDVSRMRDVYRVSVEGGTPMPVTADRYLSEWAAAPSPDGGRLAFAARGLGQWWRKGGSRIDRSSLWLMHDGGEPRYERLTDGSARDAWPMWSAGGGGLYFVSDRGGAPNVWFRPEAGDARPVTAFDDGRVLWPSISADGSRIAFERAFGIWLLETASGQARAVTITLRGAPSRRPPEHLSLTGRFSDLALSPDGKKVAFVARGEVFAASAKDGGDAERVTRTPAAEADPTWSPDSRRLAYVSERDGAARLFLYDFATGGERPLTAGGGDVAPRFSPDGRQVAFLRGGRELRVVAVDSGRERLLARGHFDRQPLVDERPIVWSPDGRWLAFLATGERLFTNASVVPASGGEARPVSFLANVGGGALAWSPDGRSLFFVTGQRTEDGRLARVDLVPRVPSFREDQFRDLFREETPPALTPPGREPSRPPTPAPSPEASPSPEPKGPVEIVFEGIGQRLRLLPVGIDAGSQAISPDGKWVVMIAETAGQPNLWVYSLDELSKEEPVARQLTSTPGRKADAVFSPDGKEVFYLDQGKIHAVPLDGKPRALAVTGEMDVDFDDEKQAVFTQAWTYLRDHFHDPAFHGADWNGVRDEYAPRVAAARNPDELRRTLNLMVGELDASHLGVRPPPDDRSVTARLGLSFDGRLYESEGRLRITEVVPLGPADVSRQVRVGDELRAVDGVRLGPRVNLDAVLAHRAGKRTVLTVAGADGRPREVAVRPVDERTEKRLLYRAWVQERREYVARRSGGRLGYVHMFDMGADSLAQLVVDLDAENLGREGVVVDVRNNNGGFVNVYAIDVLARREYLTMTPRGSPSAPARTVLGQRALERPTVLVTNQDSLSDAEDFAEGYRALGLGKVVGEPTAGWIIYTWNQPLVDGSVVRLPRMTVTSAAGEVMERRSRPVDVPVERAVGEWRAGSDAQLDAAVQELLRQLGPAGEGR